MKKTPFILTFIVTAAITFMANGKDYSFNLSAMNKGEKAERSVWITNTTGKSLSITDIQTGCICTKARIGNREIQPGDSTKLTLTFTAKDRGVFYKQVKVITSDSDCDATITLKGKVL